MVQSKLASGGTGRRRPLAPLALQERGPQRRNGGKCFASVSIHPLTFFNQKHLT